MKKSRHLQVVNVGRTHLCKHCTTDHARGIVKQWGSPTTLSHCIGTIPLSLPLGSNEVVTISSAWRVQPRLGSSEFTYLWGLTPPPPPLAHDVGFLTLSPKLDPPPFAWRPNKLAPSLSKVLHPPLCKQSRCGRYGLSNILKLQATFLYSIYHQRAGETNLFHMRGHARRCLVMSGPDRGGGEMQR